MIENLKKILLVFIIAILAGCYTITYEPVIDTVYAYEGHFYNTNEFYNATQNIQLNDNESIWVLSNKTLKRILKNTERK